MRRLATAGLALGLVLACSDAPATTSPTPTITSTTIAATTTTVPEATTTIAPTRVLVFHETAGFHHDSIPAGVTALTEIGREAGFDVTVTEDSRVFLDPGLGVYAAVVFLSTTGDVLDASEQAMMEEFIRSGKGFVGIHSASDTEYEWPWYGGLVGTYFSDHPDLQTAVVRSTGAGHPAAAGLLESFQRYDEWYNFVAPPGPDAVVLATVDESSYDGGAMGEIHPIVWAQEYDGGRSFYTAMGHTVESYSEPLFRDHLLSGILWASGVN